MKKVTVKVFGKDGHRQRESFGKSYKYDFSQNNNIRIIEVTNSDKTNTNGFSILAVTRNTRKECLQEIEAQISDGIFENSAVGKIEEIKGDKKMKQTRIECGNSSAKSGFYACNSDGIEIEPTAQNGWQGFYVCAECGKIHIIE